jgi:signal transduction histidine kinase
MLSFSRKSQRRRVPSDIRRLITETVSLAASDYDLQQNYDFRRIDIRLDIPDNLPLIPCEPATIQQVIFNLLKNGAQAMHSLVSTGHKPQFRLSAGIRENCVAITISDNGPGMPSDVRKRVFDPFFTTKDPGLGTGLGLSVSYFIIVEDHGGTLSVESEPGKGAGFTFTLPLHGSEPPLLS